MDGFDTSKDDSGPDHIEPTLLFYIPIPSSMLSFFLLLPALTCVIISYELKLCSTS
jgi:hypothetical protein